MSSQVHVVGAGVAGLSAATALAAAGVAVTLHEAAPQAGGRCRSFHDEAIDATIDNGTHLVLSGNTSIRRYLSRIGALDRLVGPENAVYPFRDLTSDRHWQVNLGRGRVPFSLLVSGNRPPDASFVDFMRIFNYLNVHSNQSVEDISSPKSAFFERFWGPVCLAVLNTPTGEAAASLLRPVVREILMQGGQACRPMLARNSLDDTFIAPATSYLGEANIRFGARLREIERSETATTLRFADEDVFLEPDDLLILAVPATVAGTLLPDISVPDRFEPIVNAHFRVGRDHLQPCRGGSLQGFVGGTAEWAHARDNILSVTVSAARGLVDLDADEIAMRLWRDVRTMTDIPDDADAPPNRVIKERRATFSQSPDQCLRRPRLDAAGGGVLLAGDWVNTGLPATIESAVRSGEQAARAAISRLR